MSDGHGGGKKRRGHGEEHEEHENHERWLVSYADMMTLLMVLFIVMFAISQVDQRKFAALKTGLTAGFGAPVEILTGGDQLLDPGGEVAPDIANITGDAGGDQKTGDQNSEFSDPQLDPQAVADLVNATNQAKAAEEVENLTEAKNEIKKALERNGMKNGATFRFDERGLVITIATDDVLFASGSAAVKPEGQRILDAVAPSLRKLPNNLSVDGHTNRAPIRTARHPSNWELSTDRATGVVRYLHNQRGLPWGRMSATGFADTRPLVPYSNPNAMSANRRVEIVVIARIDNSASKAVAELGAEAEARAAETAARTAPEAGPAPETGSAGH